MTRRSIFQKLLVAPVLPLLDAAASPVILHDEWQKIMEEELCKMLAEQYYPATNWKQWEVMWGNDQFLT